MNSFRSIRNALEYEVKRQLAEWQEHRRTLEEAGKTTRGYDESRGITVLQRSKEEAADYRYFPEPDLRPISIPRAYVDALKARVGELPSEKRARFVDTYGVSEVDAIALTSSQALGDYFEAAASGYDDPRRVVNWIQSEVKKYLNANNIEIESLKVAPDELRELLLSIDNGAISGKIAKDVFVEMAESGESAAAIIERRGLKQISDQGELEGIVQGVIDENPSTADDYRAGKAQALKYLMGQVMKATRGKANPQLADQMLRDKLGS